MLLPSSNRPIPLVRRSDLQISMMSFRDETHVVVKDPLALKYFRLPILQYRVLESLDGRNSLAEIRSRIQDLGDCAAVTTAEIFGLILDLARKRLIWSERPGTSNSLLDQADASDRSKLLNIVRNPLFIRLPGIHPGQVLDWLARKLAWIYSTPVVYASIAFVAGTWLFLLLHAETFLGELPTITSLLAGNGIVSLWIVVGSLKILHELSHGLACERFGAECQSIGLAFLFFSPCMYCDVTDAWMLPRKSHRIAVSLAGVYVELFISSLGLWLWWFSTPGLFHQICLQVFLAGSVSTLLLNANPLLRFDGYFVIADLLEIPNLYQRSRQAIRRLAARYLMGLQIFDDQVTALNEPLSMIAAYGLASIACQVPMLFGLGFFLYSLLQPFGLSSLFWIYLSGMSVVSGWRFLVWRLQVGKQQKSARRSWVHTAFTLGFSLALLTGIWFCPLRSSVTTSVMIEPRSAQPVYVETSGTVRAVCVREGDVVAAGTILIEMENLELDRQLVVLEGMQVLHHTDFRLAQAISDPDLMSQVKTASHSSAEQIEFARSERDRLQLLAPLDGLIVSAKRSIDSLSVSPNETQLESPEILDSRLLGMYLPRRTCLCEIAPTDRWEASLWVDQKSRQYLSPGQKILVRLDAYSAAIVSGTVASIGSANEATIPAALSMKSQGPFMTKSVSGSEVPTEPVYRATVILDKMSFPVQSGMQGKARFDRPTLTVGAWLTDEFHRLFVLR